MIQSPTIILVVDDDPIEQTILQSSLKKEGFAVRSALNGREALEMLRAQPADAILLDLMMPEMDGFQLLRHLKEDDGLRNIPVIVISSSEEMDSALRCIEMGAVDFLPKPFNPLLLRARLNASLSEKRLRDLERALLDRIREEQEKSERLLLNIVPRPVAERLKRGETLVVESFEEVTVLFADLVGFTRLASRLSPVALIETLNAVFSAFDELVDKHGVEKIKTSGDAYIAVGGLPLERSDHAEAVAGLALEMQAAMPRLSTPGKEPLEIRIGLNSGPVIAGVIGQKKFIYDLWGDTVNVASRMETHAEPGEIVISETTRQLLGSRFRLDAKGMHDVKGKGQLQTYRLISNAPPPRP